MSVFINSVWEFFKNLLLIAGPVIIIVFVAAILAGLIKWTYKTKDWLSVVGKNPIMLVLWILLSAVGIYFLYKYFPAIKGSG